jgi:peptide-methionine (R)-S-oxide reductase
MPFTLDGTPRPSPGVACPDTRRDQGAAMSDKTQLNDAEWRERLTPEQYEVLRQKGTEGAFTGALWDNHEDGTYHCAGCGAALFSSDTKFDSGTGWPSFFEPLEEGAIDFHTDVSHGMKRIEVTCASCGGHLGHVFEDGPRDKTGLRYCINSCSLDFDDAESPTS